MPVFVVTYAYDDRDAERDAVRPDHRDFLRSLLASGDLLASGPYTDGEPGAFLVLRAESADAALATLDADPFLLAGLVETRTVRGWDPVIGPWG